MPVGGLIAGIVNALDPGDAGKKYWKQAKGVWEDIPLPDYERLETPYYQQVGEYTPEVYDPRISGEFRGIDEDPEAQLMQLRNLRRLEDVAREGLPLSDRLQAEEAQRALASEGARAREAIVSELARRGRAGGGAELAAKLAGAGQQEELARGMGSDLAQQLLNRRLMAMGQLGAETGAYRQQNIGKEAMISEMQNRYNQWLSDLNTQAAANAAQQKNIAQTYNLGERQRLADTNVAQRYQAAQDRNQQLTQAYQNQLAKAKGITKVTEGLALSQAAKEAAKRESTQKAGQGIDQSSLGILKLI